MSSQRSDKDVFSLFIASTVHDIKNALSGVLGELEKFVERMAEDNPEDRQMAAMLNYEASRINVSLMQLLMLYKMDNENLTVTIMPVDILELTEDITAGLQTIGRLQGLNIENFVPDELLWYCDGSLVEISLVNIISNSLRYCQHTIKIDAHLEKYEGHNYLCVSVEDDGTGYPPKMLTEPTKFILRSPSRTGSTGLGLYFAGTVAQLHQKDGFQGFIRLSNNAELGGGRFELWLP